MRPARLLLPALLALATAACSSQKPAYYVTDAATGQQVSTAQQSVTHNQRGLFSSGSARTSGAYAYAAPQRGTRDGGRGLFNSDGFGSSLFGRGSSAPVYGYQPQPQPPQTYSYQPPPQQAYSYQPPQQQAYPPPSATMQYRPPQPAQQAYAQPYSPPRYPPAGYHAERYRWY